MHSKLKKFNIVFLIINIIAIITGAITFFVLGADVDELFILFGFITLIVGALIAIFIYIILGTIAETGENVEYLQLKLSSLEEDLNKANTSSGATGNSRAQLFKYDENNTGRPSNSVPGPTQWKCKFCNRINYSYTGTCACGHTKKESESKT